jgi:hypothetical protein
MGFVRPSTSAAPPILVELDSDDADEEEVAPELEGEEEEDVLDTSMERMEEGQRAGRSFASQSNKIGKMSLNLQMTWTGRKKFLVKRLIRILMR